MKTFTYLATSVAACFAINATAGITINSMIEFADKNVGEFTITNDDLQRQYIHVGINEVKVDSQGNLVKVAYTRNNIDDWSVTATPSRAIVEPSGKKTFRVQYQPLPSHDVKSDKIYQFSFVPKPYVASEDEESNSVQMTVGFSPFFIVPSEEDQPLAYKITHKGKTAWVKNLGNTYIRATFDACQDNNTTSGTENCKKDVYILAGRELNVSLPPGLQKDMSVKLSTHHAKYEKRLDLGVGDSRVSHASK